MQCWSSRQGEAWVVPRAPGLGQSVADRRRWEGDGDSLPPDVLARRAPWERRNVAEFWRPLLEGPDALQRGRALDIGCGSGRDAVHLAGRGWQVTAVELVDKALERAKRRAAEGRVEVQWIRGDVGDLARLGLEPGYSLLYYFGCIMGLSDAARRGAAAGLTELAAPSARLLFVAFKAGRRIMFPRGMDREHVVALLGDGWELQHSRSLVTEDTPPPVRRVQPTRYSLARRSRVPG